MKNKLELQLAAQATALKQLAETSARAIHSAILNDFTALKIDDKHFATFATLVNEIIYQFKALNAVPLESPAPTNAPKTP